MDSENAANTPWLDRSIDFLTHWDFEKLLITLILILAVITRFYDVGARVMAHDEVNHVVPSFDLYEGRGYRHDPVTHGPLQFHLIALSYFLFGDNDFSSRVPAALFSTAAVAFVMFGFRRYLGRRGSLIAGLLFLISPYMLFYGRYTRNEGIIELLGVVMLYAVLRYLDRGDRPALILLTLSLALHFAAKETAFIYAAQLLLFLGVLFLEQVVSLQWPDQASRNRFILLIGIAALLFAIAFGLAVWNASLVQTVEGGTEGAEAAGPTQPQPVTVQTIGEVIGIVAAGVIAAFALYFLVQKIGWEKIRSIRSFNMLVLSGTLILPQLSAFPIKMIGWNPTNYRDTVGLIQIASAVVVVSAVAVLIGLWWNSKEWLVHAAIFYGIFIVLYTTFFTNGVGFFSGLVGSLGYWLEQQSVERGSQPWYYYGLIQLPIYEFIALTGSALALYFGIRYRRISTIPGIAPAYDPCTNVNPVDEDVRNPESLAFRAERENAATGVDCSRRIPILGLLLFWSASSLVAYSIAGEKMPWLTVHIALPLLLTAAWGLGFLVDVTPWRRLLSMKGLVALFLIPVIITSLSSTFGALLGTNRPFMGNTIDQLQSTSNFLISGIVAVITIGGLVYLLAEWKTRHILYLFTVGLFAVMAVLTARAAYRASFINYDYATEYLVYAHAAPGPKEVLRQVEEISRRITGDLDIVVAYDNDALYPYWWYLRDYPNHRWYTDQVTRDLRDAPLIIAGETTMNKLEPVVQNDYVMYEYMRLWWPNQDYWYLTWDRLWGAISTPGMREAIFDIWLNRDYSLYAELTKNESLTPANWSPGARMRFYIRKDVIGQIWEYGVAPSAPAELETDPYEQSLTPLQPALILAQQGELRAPRGVDIAPDGSIYVTDAQNHRVVHYSPGGEMLGSWGTFADLAQGNAPGGTFYEPWGIAVSPDGQFVYVADTWNHRIQKFTAEGEFVTMWGFFGQAETADAFWGPRDVAVDGDGNVYVTDTGNKRIVIFDENGGYLNQFGTAGLDLGQFDEPVGAAIGPDGTIYVTDTWNQRVQSFILDSSTNTYLPNGSWEVYGWFGQSLDNKPYIAVGQDGNIYLTDPESARILVFDPQGNFVRGWSEYEQGSDLFGIYNGIAIDGQGNAWVTDAVNNRVYSFPTGQTQPKP